MSSRQRHRAAAGRPFLSSLFLSALLLPGVSLPVMAVEPLDTFSFRVAGYLTKFDTQLRADGQTSRGTAIDLERDLGMDSDNTIAMIGGTWRPFEHHEFGLSYYQEDFDSRRTLNRDVTFDGTVYEASATLRADYSLDAYDASYIWWAASNERWALGPRLGLVWYRIDLGLRMELDADGNQGSADFDRDVSTDLPAPSIGGSWRWAPTEQWRFSADAGYFSLDLGDVDADVTFARAGVEWFPWESFGFMLDYTFNDVDADVDGNRFDGRFEFQDTGVRLGGVYRF